MLDELYGSREITFTRTGGQGRRIFHGDWDDAIIYSPKPGDSFPGWPDLTVDTAKIIPTGQQGIDQPFQEYTHARVEVEYTLEYTKPKVGDPARVTWEYASEVLNTASGRTWVTTEKAIDADDLSTATVYPMASIVMDYAALAIPSEAIWDLTGKINDVEFESYDAESLLFEGASVVAQWDFDEQDWFWRLTYRFLWRPRSHNQIWRPPLRLWDADAGDWTRNADGTYQYAAGDAGEGGWDTTDPLLYETGDFQRLFPETYGT